MNTGVSQEERTLAMLAHLLGFFTSFLAPLIIYLVKKDSPFVAFHAMQQLFFQLVFIVAWIIAIILAFVLIGIPLMLLLTVGEIVYIVLACVKSFNGEWYQLPLVGKWAISSVGPLPSGPVVIEPKNVDR